MKFALRSLLKSPGFTLVALITLALGIGVNTSMYTVVETLLFKSAPYPESDRVVRIFATTKQSQTANLAFPEIQEIRNHSALFESITTFNYDNDTLAEPDHPAERLTAVNATEQFFATLRTQPFLGRAFTSEEQTRGKNQVAILSHSFWQRHYAGDRSVVGRSVRMDAEQVTIIGIMPANFEYPLHWGEVDLWRPISEDQSVLANPNRRSFRVIARLKAGVTLEQATAELKPLAERWATDRPQTSSGRGLRVGSLQDATIDDASRFYVWMLFGLSGFVLLIACANLANLQLARATANAKDLAVRSALGASRAQLIIHQLTESLLLALAGGVLGIVMASWINGILSKSIRIGNHVGLDLPLNTPVLAVATLVSLFSGIVFGLLPAWFASRTDIVTVLKQQSRGTTSGHHVMRSLLIVFQVAMGLTLLGGAGVMIRGFNSFLTHNSGWDTAKIYSASIQFPDTANYNSKDKRRLAYDRLTENLTHLTGAEATALCSRIPLFGYAGTRTVLLAGQTAEDPLKLPSAGFNLVTSDFFKTLGIALVEGKLFSSDIRADSPLQIVIGQTLARQFWPNDSALGKQLGERIGETLVWHEVIGVVRDIEFPGNMRRAETMLQYYKPLMVEPSANINLIARSASPAAFAKEMRQMVTNFDPDMAVLDSFTVPEAIDRYQHNAFLMSQIMSWFALLGLALAGVGLYGVISNVVAQRTSEFGIRLALGASPRNILRLVLRQGLTLTIIGLVFGMGLATALNIALGRFMPRAVGTDPLTLFATAVVLFGVAFLASYLPARRATKISPLDALRAE